MEKQPKKQPEKQPEKHPEKQPENYLENWKRERAEFLNYKRDESERISRGIRFANEKFIMDLLHILDNIYLAEKNIPDDLENHIWVEGIIKIKNQLSEFLKNNGVEEIKCLGEKFDPNFHEVVEMIAKEKEGSAEGESHTIVEEIQKGYTLNNKVLRPSKVKITK